MQNVCLLDVRPGFISQTRHPKRTIKKFFRLFQLSRFLEIIRNKPAMKKFLKNLSFRVNVKLQASPISYIINTHNMSFEGLSWPIIYDLVKYFHSNFIEIKLTGCRWLYKVKKFLAKLDTSNFKISTEDGSLKNSNLCLAYDLIEF